MKISIIIINKNDEGVKNTLQSLVSIVPKNTQIIVVDASDHKLDWIKNEFPSVQWVDFKSKNPRKISIPEQRNIGIKHAKGEIIVFLDASCIPEDKNWLTHLTDPIIKEGENIVRGSSSNVGEHITVSEKNDTKQYVTESPTLNMAIRKSVLDEIGVFDESFAYGSDMDLSWRAIRRGYKIRFIATAHVKHEAGTQKQNIKRYYYYGKARAKLYSKHPHKLSLIKNYEVKSFIYFVLITATPIVFFNTWYVVVLLFLFLIPLPGNPIKEVTERYMFSVGLLSGLVSVIVQSIKNK